MNHAIVMHGQGSPDVLRYEEIDDPSAPKAGEVLLRHTAIGVNYLDVYFRNGDLAPGGFPFVDGFEGAGIVEAVGDGVTDVAPGDRAAYFFPAGAYAERRIVPAGRVVRLPETIDDATAAAMMLKGCTAEYLVRRTYPVAAGDTVLIHAAAGGVGLLLVQWAKHLGATVIGTVGSTEKAELIRANGADHAILYNEDDFVATVNEITDGAGVPVVYDGVGRATFHRNFGCLATFGTNVLFGWASGKVEPVDVHALNARSHCVVNPSVGHYAGSPERLAASAAALFDVVGSGAVNIRIGQRYPLAEAARAHADLEARSTTGALLLEPQHAR